MLVIYVRQTEYVYIRIFLQFILQWLHKSMLSLYVFDLTTILTIFFFMHIMMKA